MARQAAADLAYTSANGTADLRRLTLAALGVVYGDIGTSPLYTIQQAFGEAGRLPLDEATVLGALSLIFWSLILVVTVKYVTLILRADNRGEGGVLALGTLAARSVGTDRRLQLLILVLTLAGLSLFYGDGLITPAISVMSAVEGLETATPALASYVLPISAVVLLALFTIQSRGTGRVGALFGPVMLLWFGVLAALGVAQIVQEPGVLRAVDPLYGVALFRQLGWGAFVALGAIVLAVTGAEALYADMGHFGKAPIRFAWLGLVLPALVLNYFGQGALLLRHREAVDNPFYHLVPDVLLYPMVGLATLATVIASQAVISGVFSLTHQAIQLGNLPRMTVVHTSEREIGQIYVPRMNWLLMLGVLALVATFRSSGALASAYGIAVTGTMGASAVLAGLVAATRWGWGPGRAALVFGPLLLVDLTYLAANSLKILEGGWFPIAVAAAVAYAVVTWRRGREVLGRKLYGYALTTRSFIDKLDPKLTRVRGTAVFMTGNPDVVPKALLHNLKHNKVIHERVVLMTVHVLDVPHVPEAERVDVGETGRGFWRVDVRYGFVDEPDVPKALDLCRARGLPGDLMLTSFFLSRETLIPAHGQGLDPVAERLFMALAAGGLPATAYFRIPPDRVVEVGTQVEI
jgi:KUP system potassium uptake protein